jgi:UDP-glucose 4-epimerase
LGYRSVIVKNFQRMLQGLPPTICGDGLQTLDYLYVDDAVDATLTASLYDDLPLPINVGSGVGVTILQLTEAMKRAAGRDDLPNEFIPADATHGTCRTADVSRMRQSLGFTPAVSLADGLTRTFDWIRSLEGNSVS